MARTFKQVVKFPYPPAKLFRLYIDPKLQTASTGYKAEISGEVGARFSAGDGWIRGKNLHIVTNKLIVQTWRGNDWDKTIPDTILILSFIAVEDGGTQLELFHSNVPDEYAEELKKGWWEHYWKPWKRYIRVQDKEL